MPPLQDLPGALILTDRSCFQHYRGETSDWPFPRLAHQNKRSTALSLRLYRSAPHARRPPSRTGTMTAARSAVETVVGQGSNPTPILCRQNCHIDHKQHKGPAPETQKEGCQGDSGNSTVRAARDSAPEWAS